MSDKASLRRLLREYRESVSSDKAHVIEELIIRLFDAVTDELFADAEKVRAELVAANRRISELNKELEETQADRNVLQSRIDDYINEHPV